MRRKYEPSPQFVGRVMAQVHAFEARKASLFRRLLASRPLRYALAAGGGTIVGILAAVPAF